MSGVAGPFWCSIGMRRLRKSFRFPMHGRRKALRANGCCVSSAAVSSAAGPAVTRIGSGDASRRVYAAVCSGIFCGSGRRVGVETHPLRAADALQVGAALVAAEESPATLEFVTLDRKLAVAAEREGFRVVGP